MATRFRTAFNFVVSPDCYEKTSTFSLTVPDQAMSVKEILARFTNGLPLDDNVYSGQYDGDLSDDTPESFDDLNLMNRLNKDLSDQDDFREELNGYKSAFVMSDGAGQSSNDDDFNDDDKKKGTDTDSEK